MTPQPDVASHRPTTQGWDGRIIYRTSPSGDAVPNKEVSLGSCKAGSEGNVLAETVIGLFKTEVIRRCGSRHGLSTGEGTQRAPTSLGCPSRPSPRR